MTYSEEQLALIRRMGEIARRQDAVHEAYGAAQADVNRSAIDLVSRLIAATEYAAEMGRLGRRHGDLFREFLDTLG